MSYVNEEDSAGQIPEKVEEDYRAGEPLLTPPSTKCLAPLSLDSLSSNVLPDSLWPPLLVFEWRERNYFDLLDLLNYISLAGLRLIWNTPFRLHLSMARFVCLELDLYVDIAVWFRLSGSEAHNNESSDYGDISITSGLRTNGVDKARICRHLCLKYIITKSHQFYKTEEWCYICTWQQYACNLHCYTLLSWLEIPETALESFSPTWVPVMK